MHSPILVFDIETIPDVSGLRRIHALSQDLSDAEVAETRIFSSVGPGPAPTFSPPSPSGCDHFPCLLRAGETFRVWSPLSPIMARLRFFSVSLTE